MTLLVSITTIIFLVHTIIEASMNYNSREAHILSYFTIQSNIIIAAWLLAVSIFIISDKKLIKWSVNINLSSTLTTYILVTGVIYWAVLVPVYISTADSSWLFSSSNIWLHTTTPIVALLMHNYIKLINDNTNPKLKLAFFTYIRFYTS